MKSTSRLSFVLGALGTVFLAVFAVLGLATCGSDKKNQREPPTEQGPGEGTTEIPTDWQGTEDWEDNLWELR